MFKLKNPEETDFYNETMEVLGPKETQTNYSVWQAIPRDVGKIKRPRVMAGSRAILRNFTDLDLKNGKINFAMLKDGMPFLSGDPVVQTIGEKDTARRIEPKILSTLYFMTEIATRTKDLVDNLGADRVIDVSMRATAPNAWNYATEAFLIGGGKLTATTTIRNVNDFKESRDYSLVGTTGHSLYLEYLASGYNQKEAFFHILNKFEKNFPNRPCSLLVDTSDPKFGIDDAIDVIREQKRISGQTHWIRLDSSKKGFDLFDQAKYALENLLVDDEFDDFKVIIEDGLTLETALDYDRRFVNEDFDPKRNVLYGFGGYLVNNITRDSNGAWAYKPSEFTLESGENVGVVKLSANDLKNSLAGLIGINYDNCGFRLDSYDSFSVNNILSEDDFKNYMLSSVDDLRENAKPFWDKIKLAPNKWFENYDLSFEMASLRDEAKVRTSNFCCKDKKFLSVRN